MRVWAPALMLSDKTRELCEVDAHDAARVRVSVLYVFVCMLVQVRNKVLCCCRAGGRGKGACRLAATREIGKKLIVSRLRVVASLRELAGERERGDVGGELAGLDASPPAENTVEAETHQQSEEENVWALKGGGDQHQHQDGQRRTRRGTGEAVAQEGS